MTIFKLTLMNLKAQQGTYFPAIDPFCGKKIFPERINQIKIKSFANDSKPGII